MGDVQVETQGHLLKVHVSQGGPVHGGGVRGRIRAFSAASRKRMLEGHARLEVNGCAVFITLTYPNPVPSPSVVKQHLAAFEKRLRRLYPASSNSWRFEFCGTGKRSYNPHLHLLCFGLGWIDKELVQKMWGEVTGRARPFTRIETVRSWRGVMAYVGKYMAKPAAFGRAAASLLLYSVADVRLLAWVSGLDYIAYSAALQEFPGRLWGFSGRSNLPLGKLRRVAIAGGPWYHGLKRAARRCWCGVNRGEWLGFTLFRENAGEWWRLVAYLAGPSAVSAV